MATEKKAISVYVQMELFGAIEALAQADGRSISSWVERALCRSVSGWKVSELVEVQAVDDPVYDQAVVEASSPHTVQAARLSRGHDLAKRLRRGRPGAASKRK